MAYDPLPQFEPPTSEDMREAQECWLKFLRLAREWTSPHEPPRTAGNFELMAMNVARYALGCDNLIHEYGLEYVNWAELNDRAVEGGEDPTIVRVYATCKAWWELTHADADASDHEALNLQTSKFLGDWITSGFPRLEVSHKYAAALCCTDCPIEVQAPWRAWSLVVPPDLLGPDHTPARLWMMGSQWVGMVWPDGFFQPVRDTPATSTTARMMENLIRGACLSLTNPEQHRKEGGKARGKGNKRSGPPDLSQARFMLAPPVSIDLREHIRDAIAGRAGATLKHQFLVRGHWRQQAHGAGRALRKSIWIEPHWKGPEDARVLLRSYKLGDGGPL